jgi:hypothetical protein
MRTVLYDMEAEQGLGLSKKSHAVARPLWMQRTFTQASGASLLACTWPASCTTSSQHREYNAHTLCTSGSHDGAASSHTAMA